MQKFYGFHLLCHTPKTCTQLDLPTGQAFFIHSQTMDPLNWLTGQIEDITIKLTTDAMQQWRWFEARVF